VRQYLSASSAYLSAKANGVARAFMAYSFPRVRDKCLLCGEGGFCRWKGYFRRQFVCSVLGFCGEIAIHVAHCKTSNCDYCYLPSFVIPGRRLSRDAMREFHATLSSTGNVSACIDKLVEGLDVVAPDFAMALSSAYDIIYSAVKAVRLNHINLGVHPPGIVSVFFFCDLSVVVRTILITKLFDLVTGPWHATQDIFYHPP
jgi:hypothetical protein